MDSSYSSLHLGGEFKIGTALTTTADLSSGTTDGALGTGTVIAVMNTGGLGLKVVAFGVLITTTVSGGTAITVNLASLPQTGSSSTNGRAIGSCVIPSSAVVDDCIVTFPTTFVDVNPGERIVMYVRTKSTTNGAGFPFIHVAPFVAYPAGKTGTYTKPVTTAAGSIKVV